MKKIAKTVTTEDLAGILTKGFGQQDKRIALLAETMKKGFSKQDAKIENLELIMDEKFEDFAQKVAKGFEGVSKQFEDVNGRFEKVDEQLGKIRNDILNLDDRFVTRKEFQQFVLKTGR